MVSVDHETTKKTFVDPHGEWHRLAVPARRTGLARVCRVYPHHFSASFLRFTEQVREELRPRRIGNRFCQFRMFDQSAHDKRFDRNKAEAFDQSGTLLTNEVLSSVFDPLVDTCHDLAAVFPLCAALGCFGEATLGACQGLFFRAKEARIGNLLPSGEIGKGLQSHINPYFFGRGRHGLKLLVSLCIPDCYADIHKPFPRRGAFHNGCLWRPLDGPVYHHFDMSQFGKHQRSLVLLVAWEHIKTILVLFEGEGIIAETGFKAGKPRLLPFLNAPEKVVKGPIHSFHCILKHLGRNLTQFWTDFFALLLFRHSFAAHWTLG